MKARSFIGGLHAVTALLRDAPQRILCLYILKGREDARVQELMTQANDQNIHVQFVTHQQLDDMLPDVKHQGVAVQCVTTTAPQEVDLDELLEGLTKPALLLILDGVQDPHNLGACLRTANAAGVDAVIAPKDRSVGLTPIVSKVACGAAEVTPFIQVTNLARTLRDLQERNIWLFGLAGEAETKLYDVDLTGSIALVLGAEEKGLRRLTRETCDQLVSIPMSGSVESLNVSVATGICLFEAVRQRIK